jgi:hypothetical protein
MDPALRLQPGQQNLTSAQKSAAKRFAEAYIQAQHSTGSVEEQEAEALLRQAYTVAGVAPPQAIHWLDSPAQFVWNFIPGNAESQRFSVWDHAQNKRQDSVHELVEDRVRTRVQEIVGRSVRRGVRQTVENLVGRRVRQSLFPLGAIVQSTVSNNLWKRMWESVETSLRDRLKNDLWMSAIGASGLSARAFTGADTLACFNFFDVSLAPNDLRALTHFTQTVSGYWLGQEKALIVRRPRLLSLDAAGRLHSATGKCIEYQDGWGCYAWHGVRVPEKVILAPETLTREDWEHEPNVEAARIIQERMGSRFVSELGGRVLDRSPRGTLYQITLSFRDPERVAHYVQVQDASTERHYFLRVPPTILTAAEAIAWSFGLSVEEYSPAHET